MYFVGTEISQSKFIVEENGNDFDSLHNHLNTKNEKKN